MLTIREELMTDENIYFGVDRMRMNNIKKNQQRHEDSHEKYSTISNMNEN